jgi:hypothetical protein
MILRINSDSNDDNEENTTMDSLNEKKKLTRVLSTKLSIEDYNSFLTLTKLEYEAGLIKEQSPSELLRFTICRLLVQLRNNRIYHLLEEEQQHQPGQFSSQPIASGTHQH